MNFDLNLYTEEAFRQTFVAVSNCPQIVLGKQLQVIKIISY